MIIVDNKTEDIYSVELEWSVSRSYNSGNHQFGTMGNTITEVLSIPNVNVSQLDKIQFKECRKFTP